MGPVGGGHSGHPGEHWRVKERMTSKEASLDSFGGGAWLIRENNNMLSTQMVSSGFLPVLLS